MLFIKNEFLFCSQDVTTVSCMLQFLFVVLILLTRCHYISCIPLYVHLFVMYYSNRIIYKSNSLSSPIYLKIGWVLKMICDFEKNTKVICVVKELHVSKK